MSIRARIALFGTAVVAVTLVLLSVLVLALASRGGAADRDRALQARAREAVASLAGADRRDLEPRTAPAPLDLRTSSDPFVLIVDGAGAPLVSTGLVDGQPPAVPLALLRAADGGSAAGTVALVAGGDLRVVVRPWRRDDLGLGGYVVAGQSTRRLRDDVNGIALFLVISGVVSLAAAFGASWLVAGRALRPLRTMAHTADEIGGTADLGRRLPPLRPRDELGRLTASVNGMLARLEATHGGLAEALAREQRFVADASHELRTPLTSIRANADFLLGRRDALAVDRDAAVADIVAESGRMSRLVHDLLTLARAEAGQHLTPTPTGTPFDLAPILHEVGRTAARLHPGRDVRLVFGAGSGTGAATVHGDADALRRLVWILVDNALTHAGDAARVWVCLDLDGVAGTVEVRVADNGVGVPADARERIFGRFARADEARAAGGVGLGLAIARWIATEHGGAVVARPHDGPGVSFVVTLPLAADDAAVPPHTPASGSADLGGDGGRAPTRARWRRWGRWPRARRPRTG